MQLLSFGFKYGSLQPIDSLFDVRFLKNPYFDKKLKDLTGLDKSVQDYILKDSTGQAMLDRLTAWHEWLLPEFYREGKSLFRIGIACTGGQHRSVTLVEKLYEVLKDKKLAHITLTKHHRDL